MDRLRSGFLHGAFIVGPGDRTQHYQLRRRREWGARDLLTTFEHIPMSEYIKTNLRLWLRGLIGAIIAGGAHSITAVVVAPETFNLHGGLLKLLQLGVGGGIISGAFYLQKSPLPEE